MKLQSFKKHLHRLRKAQWIFLILNKALDYTPFRPDSYTIIEKKVDVRQEIISRYVSMTLKLLLYLGFLSGISAFPPHMWWE